MFCWISSIFWVISMILGTKKHLIDLSFFSKEGIMLFY